jgi:hypothetical protein
MVLAPAPKPLFRRRDPSCHLVAGPGTMRIRIGQGPKMVRWGRRAGLVRTVRPTEQISLRPHLVLMPTELVSVIHAFPAIPPLPPVPEKPAQAVNASNTAAIIDRQRRWPPNHR